MKLITRNQARTLMRRRGEPAWQPWGEWELCEGSEGMDPGTLKRLASSWHADDTRYISGSDHGWMLRAESPWDRDEYRIVADGFDVDDYNKRLKE